VLKPRFAPQKTFGRAVTETILAPLVSGRRPKKARFDAFICQNFTIMIISLLLLLTFQGISHGLIQKVLVKADQLEVDLAARN
jgi:hypothetical protein